MISNRQLHLNHLAQTNPFPLLIDVERAEGVYIYSTGGKRYYDLISGIAVSNLGHNHPRIRKAVLEQVKNHMHVMVYGEYVQRPQLDLAAKLIDLLPERLDTVYFVNSGAEATEGALKLAKRASGRSEIIYFRNSYHGSTAGALSVMGDEVFKSNFRPLIPGCRQLEYNNLEELQKISSDTAAVIIETVQAESGVTVPDRDFMISLRNICSKTGALLILDEIQCGMGRTGELFAFEHFGIEPDILLLAKALGGGMPLGAFISSRSLMSELSHSPMLGHITTFGGHPVCCAAGFAALQEIYETGVYKEAVRKAQIFKDSINSFHIKAFHTMGLMIAIWFDSFESNKKVIDRCLENGLMTDWFLFNNRAMRISPPLTMKEDEIEECCEIIEKSITEALS